jgi:hypothetical protein
MLLKNGLEFAVAEWTTKLIFAIVYLCLDICGQLVGDVILLFPGQVCSHGVYIALKQVHDCPPAY